jgi:hypothetical protein
VRKFVAFACFVALAGCGANPAQLASLGQYRVQPHTTDPNLLIVQVMGNVDLGYNLTDATQRRAFIENALREQCGAPTIEKARYTIAGRGYRTYTLDVRCPNGASTPADL